MDVPITSPPSLGRLRTAAVRLGRETACRLIVLFGSAARREPRPGDLDIAILADEPLDTLAATNALIRRLGVQQVDVADLRRADPLLLAFVARDGVPLYEREPGEFDRFASLAARRYADTQKFRAMERREIHDLLRDLPVGA
jgi:predicted nucleotidyltransferase